MNYLVLTSILSISAALLFFSAEPIEAKEDTAIFGGGCFWCMEPPFEQIDGVIDVVSGYTGGTKEEANYSLVSSGKTAHYEAVRVRYNPSKVSYEELVETFWRQIDPTDGGGQFADRGRQYRTAIFYNSDEQKAVAQRSKEKLDQSGMFDRPVVTEILPESPFYEAEEYHQDYYQKNPIRYKFYRYGSGRDQFLKKTWNQQ